MKIDGTNIDRLREVLDIQPSGTLVWRKTLSNRAQAGEEAGTRSLGYILVSVGGRKFQAHRIVWALTHGAWPAHFIDHINGIKDDNRPENLREATQAQNQANRHRANRNSVSARRGVSWDSRTRSWAVCVKDASVTRHFGRWADHEFADLVAIEARRRLFGEFAGT